VHSVSLQDFHLEQTRRGSRCRKDGRRDTRREDAVAVLVVTTTMRIFFRSSQRILETTQESYKRCHYDSNLINYCYRTGGEFVLHHSSVSRVLPVLYYLNGVGGTWFPLANATTSPGYKRQTLCHMEHYLTPCTYHVLLVRGKHKSVALGSAGDAVAFLQFSREGFAKADWKAIHTG
jgi:hypothetical protein